MLPAQGASSQAAGQAHMSSSSAAACKHTCPKQMLTCQRCGCAQVSATCCGCVHACLCDSATCCDPCLTWTCAISSCAYAHATCHARATSSPSCGVYGASCGACAPRRPCLNPPHPPAAHHHPPGPPAAHRRWVPRRPASSAWRG